jgi:D-alanyl-D-alanine carboxypeptidase/D-alanyl-D-alanine-endopeptidase (penicillin-binding protein 4)
MRLLLVGLAGMLGACVSPLAFKRQLTAAEEKFNDHIGFVLYDPGSRKTLIDFNSARYFTPASNTKIFTFYTALQILGDSVPALKYTITNDSLIFWGTGDPSFLYKKTVANSQVYEFLRSAPQKLFFSSTNFQTAHFGPGWAWDDYNDAYSAERSPFPIFGNLVEVVEKPDQHWTTIPSLFTNHLVVGDSVAGEQEVIRDIDSNQMVLRPGKERSLMPSIPLPFHYSGDVMVEMLSDTLKRPVEEINYPLAGSTRMVYSIPTDSLYKVMMQESDNFIAEQLLLLCAGVVSDTLKPEIAIRYAKKNLLFDLPDRLLWVDGSGLSRYNLFTPRSIVRLWDKIYAKVPSERLFKLLAVGGQSGTLRSWNKEDKPYVFGKTGFLSNNQSLSGYLLTKKGKVLIFSFMNANFIASSREIRKTMQEFLAGIRDKY